jgi:hypothetical protein
MEIFNAREEDAHQGWVWLQNASLPARGVIKITNPNTRKSVYCEALQIDANFLKSYNQSPRRTITKPEETLVIGAWYRAGLGEIGTRVEIPLTVCASNSWLGQFLASVGHPQVVVRLAAWLGGTGLILGVIGLILGIVSLW